MLTQDTFTTAHHMIRTFDLVGIRLLPVPQHEDGWRAVMTSTPPGHYFEIDGETANLYIVGGTHVGDAFYDGVVVGYELEFKKSIPVRWAETADDVPGLDGHVVGFKYNRIKEAGQDAAQRAA